MTHLNVGAPIYDLEGNKVPRPDGSTYCIRHVLTELIGQAIAPEDGEEALIFQDLGMRIVRQEGDTLKLENGEFAKLHNRIKEQYIDNAQTGNTIVKAALKQAFDNAKQVDNPEQN